MVVVRKERGTMATATLTFRLPEEEKQLITDYAHTFGRSVSEFVRESVMERIKGEFDVRELLKAISQGDGVRYSMEEVMDLAREAE